MRPTSVFGILFSCAIVTMGLTEYRPLLGGVGNLSDCLFLAAFAYWLAISLLRLNRGSIENSWTHVRSLESLIWGGILISIGGAVASFDSSAPALS